MSKRSRIGSALYCQVWHLHRKVRMQLRLELCLNSGLISRTHNNPTKLAQFASSLLSHFYSCRQYFLGLQAKHIYHGDYHGGDLNELSGHWADLPTWTRHHSSTRLINRFHKVLMPAFLQNAESLNSSIAVFYRYWNDGYAAMEPQGGHTDDLKRRH